MNIFKLMQHENHELKTIIKEDKVLLGMYDMKKNLENKKERDVKCHIYI